jgi:hypothetical protein
VIRSLRDEPPPILLSEMGIDVILVVVECSSGPAHVAIGVRTFAERDGSFIEFERRRYYYCEATPAGTWRFGEIPPDLSKSMKSITPIPISALQST